MLSILWKMKMEQLQHLIECDHCKKSFAAEDIEIYPKIVRRNNIVAVAYCFKCPLCGQEYVCYFKDSQVNAFFRKGDQAKAQVRMKWLKELFTSDNSV